MATYDSAWCLATFDRLAGRPDADEISDANKYQRLAEAQQQVIEDVAAVFPYCLYRSGGPTATTTSGGIVHTFGSDGQGHAVGPVGHVWIGRSTSRYPDVDLIEGVDFINEGTQIRMVNERVEPTLYWNGIPTPTDISASQEPAIRPAPARMLIVVRAVWNFAEEGNQQPDLAAAMERRYAQELTKHMLVWKTQFRSGGGLVIDGFDRAVLRQGMN